MRWAGKASVFDLALIRQRTGDDDVRVTKSASVRMIWTVHCLEGAIKIGARWRGSRNRHKHTLWTVHSTAEKCQH
eukprot:1255240-Pleurochrysis_carterae.AAC.2